MAYRAIFFDLGNVLVPFDLRRAYGALEAVSPLSIPEMATRLSSNGLVTDYECGRIEDGPFCEAICRLLEMDCGYTRFCEIWNSIFLPPTLVPESLLAALRERYTLLLLSNTNGIHFRFLEQNYPHIAHFHHRTLSHEAGAQKPNPEIYRKALEQAGVEPASVFFTDDLAENIEAAKQMGMDGEQFIDVDALQAALKVRGILG